MKSYELTLRSLSPYLQYRMDDISLAEWEKKRGPIIERSGIGMSDVQAAAFR